MYLPTRFKFSFTFLEGKLQKHVIVCCVRMREKRLLVYITVLLAQCRHNYKKCASRRKSRVAVVRLCQDENKESDNLSAQLLEYVVEKKRF